MSDDRARIGRVAERAAAGWYIARGYAVLAENWRVREGEIDLVVCRDDEIVFCEVKARASHRFGSPYEAVTASKQRRLRMLASRYLATHAQPRRKVRFDVAAVSPAADGPRVEVVEAAF